VFPTLADDIRAWIKPRLAKSGATAMVAGLVLLKVGQVISQRASRL
jgi:hypothetical protein